MKLADGETAYSFIDLPKYAPDGHIYEYSVAEDAVPGYTSVKTGNDFTNTVEQVWTDITVTKIWVDDGAGEGVVHPTITIYLLRNGERIAEVQLPDGVTSYTFSNLPTYDLVTGAVYTYSAEEEAVPNYETAIDGMTITNTFIAPEVVDLDITITGTKTWEDDGREHDNASEVQLVLSRSVDGGEEETVTGVVPTWWNNRYYFNDMPRFDEEGRMYRYSVTELPMEGYVAVYEGNNIINRQVYDVLPVEISGTKHWNDNDNAEGTRPESITVQLLRDGELIETVTVTAEDNWSYTFTDLPDNDGFGNYYTYSVGEQMVAGYWLRVEGYDLYNTLFTEEEPGIFGMRNMNEGELEELLTLLGYEVPLWGGLLGTGDELPAYPFVFGGCGLLALAAYIVLNRKSKKA